MYVCKVGTLANRTMFVAFALIAVLSSVCAFAPREAFAMTDAYTVVQLSDATTNIVEGVEDGYASAHADGAVGVLNGVSEQLREAVAESKSQMEAEKAAAKSAKEQAAAQKAAAEAAERATKVLAYDPAIIDEIGTQQGTGHSGCCPSFSCAYADAVLDGTVHDHSYYTCSCCTWTDWGGGDSSFRCVGTDEQLLREAYDQITAGKPTVIHVSASYGQHWIALIGYVEAYDPDHLTLSNFIALDPWDGSQVNAGASFALYGDGCEHISTR